MKWPLSRKSPTEQTVHEQDEAIRAILAEAAPGAAVEAILPRPDKLTVVLAINPANAAEVEAKAQECEDRLCALEGIEAVQMVFTAHSEKPSAPQTASPAPAPRQAPKGGGHRPLPTGGSGQNAEVMPGVKKVIAVASGKGGVGKSTVSVNLALALKAQGLSVGLLDADIYGPSMPIMLGTDEKPKLEGDLMVPVEAHGLKTMSIGYLAGGKQAMIWRGPMVMGALGQMMTDVAWGDLDVMIVDLPPGTGDAQLTLVQRAPLTGAVIVSTPQEVALADARRGIEMFQRTEVPILGLVENMSYFEAPDGERLEIFGHGGVKKTAEELDVPFLGEIPLDMKIREHSDKGTPVVVAEPESAQAKVFLEIAEKLV